MMLIGQYDSPFVRRVAVTLKTYGLPFEHSPWSTFGDVDRIAQYNPLRRVPTLVMDDGVAMIDSGAIIEVIDDLVGPERASLALAGTEKRERLRLTALAAGAADKGVSLVYERAFREGLPMWVERCRAQISDTLAALEAERAARITPWLFGETMSHADVMLATMYVFIDEATAAFDMTAFPALTTHAQTCAALPAFADSYQAYRLTLPGG